MSNHPHADVKGRHAAAERVAVAEVLPNRTLTVLVLVISDLVALVSAGALAGCMAVSGVIPGGWPELLRNYYLIILVPLAYTLTGLYPAVGMSPIDEFRRLVVTTGAVFAASVAGIAVVGAVLPSWVLVVAGALALGTVPVGRAIARELFARRRWWGVPVVVLGAGRTADLVLERLQAYPRVGMRAIACLDDDVGKVGSSVQGVPVLGPLSKVREFQARGVRHVLVTMPGLEPHQLVPLLRRYGQGFPAMVVVPNLFGVASVGVSTRDLGGVLGLFVRHNLLSRINRTVKACLDAALLVPGLIGGLPVIAVSALAVMLVSPGNPFYAQEREGLGGRTFRVWKLRTMHHNADVLLAEYLDAAPERRLEWERHFKLERDPRILPVVGHALRKSSFDELPQIVNVLRGEMSFIGPRPFPRYHLDAFSDDFRELRASVRPGITGLWQVSARSEGDLRVQEELDTFYIRNWSVWMDLYVLARTPVAVLMARGAR